MDLSENVDNSSCDQQILLPIEVWDTILRNLKSCEDRNNGRLVCSLWEELLNRNCSGEKMLVPKDARSDPKKWSVLMKSQRRYINYHISKSYGNLNEFDGFFDQRGDFITSLHISECTLSVSKLKMILSNCQNLQMFVIGAIEYDWFRYLWEDEVRHYSLTHLVLSPAQVSWCYVNLLEMIDSIREIRTVLPNLKRLEMENVKEFPDASHLKILQNMRFNMVIIGNDIYENQFRIDENNNTHVNVKYARFFFNDKSDTFITDYKQPHGKTEKGLLEFMTMHNNLQQLFIDLTSWNFTTLNFPPIDFNVTQYNLKKLDFYGEKVVVLRHCPALFNKLETLNMDASEVENFSPEIIAQMTNMKELSINNISYSAFVAVCEHMPLLEKFRTVRCTDFDENLRQMGLQKNLVKLKNLKVLTIPGEILDTEEEYSPAIQRVTGVYYEMLKSNLSN